MRFVRSFRVWLLCVIVAGFAIAQPSQPSQAQARPNTDLILSGNVNLAPSVYVFAQSATSVGIYYINGSDWQLVTSIPVSSVTVDTVKAKLSPNGQQVAFMVTDGETGQSGLYTANLYGMNKKRLYISPASNMPVTSFAWHGDALIAYTLARGPFAPNATNGTAQNPTEQSAQTEYVGQVWISTTDGISQTQIVSQTAGLVLGSVNATSPLYYTTVNTDSQQLTGLNSVDQTGTIETLLSQPANKATQTTFYTSFELAKIGNQTKLVIVSADTYNATQPIQASTLQTANLDGTNVTTIFTDTADIGRAVWSADGSRIAYIQGVNGTLAIRNQANGTTTTMPQSVQSNIQWSSDSTDIVSVAALNTATNPFSTGFVVQSLDGTVTASASTQANANTNFNQYKVPSDVPYVHQKFDTPSWFTGKNVSCGSTSTVMALAYVGKLTAPYGNWVPEFHPWASYGREPAEAGLNSKGVAHQRLGWGSLQDIIYALERNHVVIAGTGLTGIGHIVLIVGYERSGNDVRLITNDPWGNKNAGNYGNYNNGKNAVYTWEQMGVSWTIEVLATTNGTPPPDPNQWRGEYYNNRDLAGSPSVIRNDANINFDWGTGSPAAGINSDNFSVRWKRQIYFPSSGIYRFRTISDDGLRMWIDSSPILNQWYPHGTTEVNSDIYVGAGTHTVQVEFYEEGGGATAKVSWQWLSTSGGWQGAYYPNRSLSGSPAFIRQDSAIDFNWGTGSPGAGVGTDNFSVRWNRTLYLPGGAWQFYTRSDDGSRAWVGGAKVVDQWWDHGVESAYSGYYYVNPGNYNTQVEFYENSGGALMQFDYWPRIWAEFFDQMNFSGNRKVAVQNSIDHNWGIGGPHAWWWQNNFSSRFTWPVALRGGDYRICVDSDDGFRFYVDGQLRINRWYDSAYQSCATLNISAGWRTFRLEHYENGGGAKVRFSWGRADGAWYGTGIFARNATTLPIYTMDSDVALAQTRPQNVESDEDYFQLMHEQGTLGFDRDSIESEVPRTNVYIPLVTR